MNREDYIGTKWIVVDSGGWSTDKGCVWELLRVSGGNGFKVRHTFEGRVQEGYIDYGPGHPAWDKRLVPYHKNILLFAQLNNDLRKEVVI